CQRVLENATEMFPSLKLIPDSETWPKMFFEDLLGGRWQTETARDHKSVSEEVNLTGECVNAVRLMFIPSKQAHETTPYCSSNRLRELCLFTDASFIHHKALFLFTNRFEPTPPMDIVSASKDIFNKVVNSGCTNILK
ncbi:hypothetical protein IRJ41_025820, partial [Triplophysa rosa]